MTSKDGWTTKNYKTRVVPMTEVLYQELTRHYLRFRKRGQYCYCHPDGTRYSDLRGTLSKVARAGW